MSTETDSIRALAAEVKETVILMEQFYSCVVRDPRHASGQFLAVKAPPVPKIEEEMANGKGLSGH